MLHQPKRICFDGIIYRPAMPYVKAKTYNKYKTVDECPHYSPADISIKCTKKRDVTERIMTTPMTSLNTHLTYDNIYCAQCNNDAQNLESWYFDFQCKMKINFNILSSVNEIANLAIQNNCTIITRPVYNHKSFIESCEDDPKGMISECNKTGTWLNGDNAILNACQSVDQPFGMFKNVFCYICNPPIVHKEVITSCSSNNHNTSLFQLCLEHVYYVLPRYCNGQSQMAMYGNTTAVVDDTLQMNVTDSQNSNEDIPFARQWQYMITCQRQEIFIHFDAIISENAHETVGIDLIRTLADEAFDNLNTRLINTPIQGNMKYVIPNISCNNINIKTSFSGYLYFDFCTFGMVSRHDIDSNLLHLLNSTITLNQSDLIVRVKYETDSEAFNVPSLVENIAVDDLCTYQNVYSIHVPGKLAMYYRVNNLLLCTQVELTTHEYAKQRNREIKLHSSGHILGRNEYLTVKNNSIRVCSDRYLQLISEVPLENINISMFIIRVICNVVSLICLILTFITYILFKSLRTVPGQNNMTLVLCMNLNELLFHVRLYSLENVYLCQAIGVLQHYFFLTVFTSFNVCTFHIYRVFTKSFSTTANSNIQVLFKYKAYIFGIPAIIVTSNILVTFIYHDYQSIGYGGDLCFIVFKLAAIITFLCPVGIILLTNVFMFAAAIFNICTTPHVTSENVSHDKKTTW
ncbi:unnamed protein product [Mytilus edulis]|uniref:G-protein coupled receptors family 2 profile 2 domain-containing protein n=1 Tax=Mytilus edulis TaxID=6550 RepID=A0A8S3T0W0_MYTED|nr:unnamed protein product [Mytilus edulis]